MAGRYDDAADPMFAKTGQEPTLIQARGVGAAPYMPVAGAMGQAAPGMPDMGGPEMTPDLMPGGDMALEEAAYDIIGALTSTPPEQSDAVLEVMSDKYGEEIVTIIVQGMQAGEFDDIVAAVNAEGIGPGGGMYGTGEEMMYPEPGAEYGYPEGRF
jgi:hypothetical protein